MKKQIPTDIYDILATTQKKRKKKKKTETETIKYIKNAHY